MGLFSKILRDMPGGPKSVAKNLLKYYLLNTARYPHLDPKEIYRKMLQDRNVISKMMNANEIEKIVAKADNLLELTLGVIAHENPAAVSPQFEKETIDGVFGFFKENAPGEFTKFINKVESLESKVSQSEAKVGRNAMNEKEILNRYELESQIATLIDDCTHEMFNAPHSSIVMNKDCHFAWTAFPEEKLANRTDIIARVYLKEVEPWFQGLRISKEAGENSRDPAVHMITDRFAKTLLDLLLKRIPATT